MEKCQEEIGYITAIFMSQGKTKADDIIMPTEQLEEVSDRIGLYLFKAFSQQRQQLKQAIDKEIEKMDTEIRKTRWNEKDIFASGKIEGLYFIKKLLK